MSIERPADALKPAPALIVMVGAPGSGKSYLAEALASELGAHLIQTDAVRKELFPLPRYTSQEATAVYGECHARIRAALRAGSRVIFDGTNLRERRRRVLYDLADTQVARLLIVAAYAPVEVIRARLERRMRSPSPGDLSDADWSIYLRLRKDADPIERPHIIVNTQVGFGPIVRLVRCQLT